METLPSSESFLAEFGIEARPVESQKQSVADRAQVQQAVAQAGVSREMFDLLTQYCSVMTYAHELEEVNWVSLAKRLGTKPEYLAEAAESVNADGLLWNAVLGERIKKASSAKIFRDASWERLESIAVNRLMQLAEKNLIRDPGELLAVASHARRANTDKGGSPAGNTVNINIGGESMDGGDNGLPAAGAKMTIDLTPRVASALTTKKAPQSGIGNRVIDGKMLSATELRDALMSQRQEPADVLDDPNQGDVNYE